MAQPVQALRKEWAAADDVRASDATFVTPTNRAKIRLALYEELSSIAVEWRTFQQRAHGTVFQTFEWLSTWQRHVGARRATVPVTVIGYDGAGETLFLLPLAIEPSGFARRLTWLGADLCDYNAPLLAADFSERVTPAQFRALWDDVLERLRSHPHLSYDFVDLDRMPETVGPQKNPMLQLRVTQHCNRAYLVQLEDSWEKLYARRSSATRRHDRSKRKKLAEHGEVRFVSGEQPADVALTLDTLMAQKTKWFAEMGLSNIFARPGCRDFFLDIASNPQTRHLVHVGRLDVGSTTVATNFGLIFGERYFHVLASYDRNSELSKFGPGAAHLHDLLAHAIGRGCRVFDFSVGDERYKREWCDSELKLYDHVSPASLRGALSIMPLMAVRRVVRWIKETPAVWQAVRKARAYVAPLRG